MKRRRYQTRARLEAKERKSGFPLARIARANLAENIGKMLAATVGNAGSGTIYKSAHAAAVLVRLEEAWKIGATDDEAAMCAGISRTTLSEIKQQMPELAERAEQLKIMPTHTARGTIVKNLKKPRWSAWYLERKAPEEFAAQQKVEHSGQMLFSHFAGKQGNYERKTPPEPVTIDDVNEKPGKPDSK